MADHAPARDDPRTPPVGSGGAVAVSPPSPAASVEEAACGLPGLLRIMAALRTPGTGCAWDLTQTHASLVPDAIEEAYEVADAVERGDPDDLRDELGDLLFQVVFHARLAEEAGAFAFGDVVHTVSEKMIRRHPHVFAGVAKTSRNGVVATWERIKDAERAAKTKTVETRTVETKTVETKTVDAANGVLAGVAVALPGLTRAIKLQGRASRVGFDWGDAKLVLAKIREEVDEIEAALDAPEENRHDAVRDEIGDLLFAVANLARHAAVDPETAVRGTNAKFERRFAFIERRLGEKGSRPEASTLEEMDALWVEAKRAGL